MYLHVLVDSDHVDATSAVCWVLGAIQHCNPVLLDAGASVLAPLNQFGFQPNCEVIVVYSGVNDVSVLWVEAVIVILIPPFFSIVSVTAASLPAFEPQPTTTVFSPSRYGKMAGGGELFFEHRGDFGYPLLYTLF